MAEFSFPWPDSSVDYDPQIGDGRKITAEEYAGYFWHVYGAGVIPLADNELVVTTPGANQISVDTGWAICGGRLYHNDAALALAPASAGAGSTRQDSVILQCDWTGGGDTEQYTVRAIIKEGTAGAPPALTQTINVLWEERLYSYTIDDAGDITGITDARTFATFNTMVDEDNLAASVAGDGLTGGEGAALAVNVDGTTIETNADALRVKDGGISTAKIAAGALSANAAGRALMAAAFFAAGNATSYAFFENAFWTTTRLDKFADGIWAATVAGRAKFADGIWDNSAIAKFADALFAADAASRAKFADGIWNNAAIAKFADALFAADAASRAKFADGIWTAAKLASDAVETAKIKDANVTNAKLADDCHRMVGEMIEIAGATLGGTDGRRAVIGGVAHESWVHCDGGVAVNGVTIPDTRDRVIGGASGTNPAASTAGAATANIAHEHNPGTLGTDNPYAGTSVGVAGGSTYDVSYELHGHPITAGRTASALSAAQDMRQPTYYVYRFIYVG